MQQSPKVKAKVKGWEASDMAGSEAARTAIMALLDASTRYLDRQNFDSWLDLFTDNAAYQIVCEDGVTELGTVVLDQDRAGLKARIALLAEPFRVREKVRQSHLVTWGSVNFDGDAAAQAESRFALFETRNLDGVSKLSYVGRYEDKVVKGEDGRWRLAGRKVVLDTFSFRSLLVPL